MLGCLGFCMRGGLRWGFGAALPGIQFSGAFRGALFAFLVGFGVGDVLELLRATRKNFRGEDAILFVDGDADQSLELSREKPVSAEGNE